MLMKHTKLLCSREISIDLKILRTVRERLLLRAVDHSATVINALIDIIFGIKEAIRKVIQDLGEIPVTNELADSHCNILAPIGNDG